MKNMTKGALAMVFAGAITFSAANAWLDGEPTKLLLTKVKTITDSLNRKMADHPNLVEKKRESQKAKKPVGNLTSNPSQNWDTLQISNESQTVKVTPSSPKGTAETSTKPVTPHLSDKVSVQSVSQKKITTRSNSTRSTQSTTTKTVKTTNNNNASGASKRPTTSSATTVHGAHSTTKSSSANSTHSHSTTGATTNTKTNHGTQISSVEKQKHVTSQPSNAATNNGKKPII